MVRWVGGLGAALLGAALPAMTQSMAADARWDGFYLGGHVGYGRGDVANTVTGLAPFNLRHGSLYGGLQGGYNYQLTTGWVAGVEADISFPNAHPTNDVIGAAAPAGAVLTHTMDFVSTLRGRVGFTRNDWLFYVTGGLAGARTMTTRVSAPGADDDINRSAFQTGWVAGAGIEVAINDPWSVRAEYLHHRFSGADFTFPGGPTYRAQFDLDVWRVGLNYRFGEHTKTLSSARDANWPQWEIHGQSTAILQGYPRFRSPYAGQNSFTPWPQAKSTFTASAFLGVKVWDGGEVYYNPELLQGYGLNSTVGAGGFPNGEAQKSDFLYPHYSTSRLFVRQTFGFGGEQESVESSYGQMAGKRDVSRLSVQVGRFAVHDVFDNNAYANDPRADFLNWSIWAAGAFDYPADRIGLTYGAVADFNQKAWAVRTGYFLVGKESNSSNMDMMLFRRGGYVTEYEARYTLGSQPGKIRLLGWLHNTFSGRYAAATALSTVNPAIDINTAIVQVRGDNVKYGYVVNLEQALSDDVGLFARWSWNNGRNEVSAFTDIDSSLSGGAVIKGARWGRPDDKLGFAGAINGLSADHRNFLAAGGLGVLVGDGRLNYGTEKILETFYAFKVAEQWTLTADYQLIVNPAYNRDRGPVSVFSGRVHWEY
jgi:high affinity Mn2+ porin